LFGTAGANSGETGTDAIIGKTKVWSDGNALHISAATETQADIYSITGALVKKLRLSAGEVQESLERGLYIVKTPDKAAKVVIR